MTGTGSASREPSRRPENLRVAVESVALALLVYVIAGAVEGTLVRTIRPTTGELTWISDVVLSSGLGVAVFLWRHLQATRRELSERERRSIVLDTQLSMAADMQRRLLPQLPVASDTTEWAAALVPAGQVGGDFYDEIEVAPGVWMIIVADVSGKGIAAAMALALVRATFRALAREEPEPSALVTRLSAVLYGEWRGTPYLTCIVGRLDGPAGTLAYVNAGHPPGLIVRGGAVIRLADGGPPVGLISGSAYAAATVALVAGDACVFVSDGITEALADDLAESLSRVAAAVRAAEGTATAICQSVMTLVRSGPGPGGTTGWDDDRTVFVVTIRRDRLTASVV